MKKIVITGGLGYIGTELCKIYSGYSWNDKITVIDNRFISERVNQIRNWNMNFVQGDILDRELIKKYCQDADIVHHLYMPASLTFFVVSIFYGSAYSQPNFVSAPSTLLSQKS